MIRLGGTNLSFTRHSLAHPAVRSFFFGGVIRERANPNSGPLNDFMYWYQRDDVKVSVCCSGVSVTFDALRCDPWCCSAADVGILRQLRAPTVLHVPCNRFATRLPPLLPYVDHGCDHLKVIVGHWRRTWFLHRDASR